MSAADLLKTIMRAHQRVAIAGGPKTGKTTLCEGVKAPIVHSDDLIPLGWSEASQALAERVNAIAGPVVVEGVAVPRALRKGMRVDAVLLLHNAHQPLTDGQRAMTTGVHTVLSEWRAANPLVPVYEAHG